MLHFIKSTIKNKALFNELIKELNRNIIDEKKVVKLIKNKEIDINQLDDKGRTLLFDLVKKRKTESIKLLLKHGLKLEIEDIYGKTVMNEAIDNNDGVMVRFLLDMGFSLNYINKSRRSIVQDIALEGKHKLFEIFIVREADLLHKDSYNRNVLFDAIEGESFEIIEEIVNNVPPEELNVCDNEGQSALFNAVLKEDSRLAIYLIKHGIDVNIVNFEGRNALFNAVLLGADNLETIEKMIRKGIDLSCSDNNGFNVVNEILMIYKMVKKPIDDDETKSKYRLVKPSRNYLKLMTVMMQYDLPINEPQNNGKSLLYNEVMKKSVVTIDFLLKAGASLNVPNEEGQTVLFSVIYGGVSNIRMIEYLIEHGADIEHRDYEERTVIDEMVDIILIQQNYKRPEHRRFLDIKQEEHYFGVLKRLLAYRPHINKPKSNGQTIIYELVNYNDFELLKLFLNYDIDLHITDDEQKTPLCVMVENGLKLTNPQEREDFIKRLSFLLKYRVNVNAADKDGRTVLHKAVIANDLEVIEKLIASKKVDLHIKDKQGRTALHHTQWRGNTKIARLLIATGAHVNEPDGAGYTLLNYAAILGHLNLVQVLISYGVLMYNKNKKSKSVTQFFIKNESNLDKLLHNSITDVKMQHAIAQVVKNLKKEIHEV